MVIINNTINKYIIDLTKWKIIQRQIAIKNSSARELLVVRRQRRKPWVKQYTIIFGMLLVRKSRRT